MSVRVSRARCVVANGRRPATVAKVPGVSRQANYETPKRRPPKAGPGRPGPADAAIVEFAKQHPTDGARMIAAISSRELGESVNRKRVQRIMRARRLLQLVRGLDRRSRPGFFRVTRPDELRHTDMTKVWCAQLGWVFLDAIVECCTREITGWNLDVRGRSEEAIACVNSAIHARGIGRDMLTIGTDNVTQFTSRPFREQLAHAHHGITHRRGGYRDPGSQAFIEAWFGRFKRRVAWRAEWQSLDHA